jgi:hypothetical protein
VNLSVADYLEPQSEVVLDRPVSEVLAARGMEQAAGAERIEMWRTAAHEWLASQPRGRRFSMDEMHSEIGFMPGFGANKANGVGGWISGQSKLGRIRWTGDMVRSERPERHVGISRLWEVQ